MEAYPPEYVEHNLPLVVLSGLGQWESKATSPSVISHQESGTKFQASCSECTGDRAQILLQQFQQLDGTLLPWNSSSLPGPSGTVKYKIKSVGRSYSLPPRKAAPLPQSPSLDGFPGPNGGQVRSELHSPLSPLSPSSPIFPDGIFTPMWLAKHQYQVPALFLAFFDISASNPQNGDEQLKADINAIKSALTRSGFKTRFAAVLLSDRSILNAPQLDERLSSIRRLTSLDSKTGLFFMPPMSSPGEIATFVQTIMTTLQPSCLEYYRDLTKHARRKKTKNSGNATAVTMASGDLLQPLSATGWSVRYELKQGIFAEIRQEMEVAERHYSAVVDEVCGPEGIFQTTPSTSPRWSDARLLCDSVALRIARCHLWTSQTTTAARFWTTYKGRMTAIVQRYGKGLDTPSWAAWEARWAEIMAQLIHCANPTSLQYQGPMPSDEDRDTVTQQVFAVPEKIFPPAERLPPFQYLHHAGYWLNLALRGCRARWHKAEQIPDEDRISPDRVPAATLAGKMLEQDLYLVPPLHQEARLAKGEGNEKGHFSHIASLAQQSAKMFEDKVQGRSSSFVNMSLAKDLIHLSRHQDAIDTLRPLYEDTNWRQERWFPIFADLLLAVRPCAEQVDDHELVVATTYEMLSIPVELLGGARLELEHCLDENKPATSPMSLSFENYHRLSPITVLFGFSERETYVGEPLQCQLEVASRASDGSGPLRLSEIKVRIGSAKTITISHQDEDSQDFVTLEIESVTDQEAISGQANLVFKPGQQRCFSFSVKFREASSYSVKQASIKFEFETFRLEHTFNEEAVLPAKHIYTGSEAGEVQRLPCSHYNITAITVLPKPPKVKLRIHGQRKEYYTHELVQLGFELNNAEADAVEGQITANTAADADEALQLRWDGGISTSADVSMQDGSTSPTALTIPQIEAGASHTVKLLLQMPPHAVKTEVVVALNYHVVSDKQTGLQKKATIEIEVVPPFEAKFNFGPLLHAGPWPSYFKAETAGIPQLWRLGTLLRSTAAEALIVHDVRPVLEDVVGDSQATVHDLEPMDKLSMPSGQAERLTFELLTQKDSLDDRRPTTLRSTLAITWSREGQAERPTTTHLPVPRLTLPVSEPRVLCTVTVPSDADECDAILSYCIENPSAHFLTFAITMEATEDFAFSGPKFRTLSLAPLTRYQIDYRVMLQEDSESSPEDEDGHWIWPSLQVVDSYYQKTLRIHPGGAGVKVDEKQNIGVLVTSGSQPEALFLTSSPSRSPYPIGAV